MRQITIEDICKKLKPVLGKKADQLYLKYALAETQADRAQIQQLLHLLYEKHLNTTLLQETILLEPPQSDIVTGDYPLGMVTYAQNDIGAFGLREQDWPRHLCITGMSGSGKTNFAFQILANFILHKKPFLLFDWKKSDHVFYNWKRTSGQFIQSKYKSTTKRSGTKTMGEHFMRSCC